MLMGFWLIIPLSQCQANDRLLDILKSKGIITDQQLKEINNESMNEVNASYRNGFKLETGDHRFSLQLGGKIRADFRYFANNSAFDTFDLRKAKFSVGGTVFKDYDYKLSVGFDSGTAKLKDAYIRYNFSPDIQLKAGQFKHPFGYERQYSSRYYPFMERATTTSGLTSSRDRGIGLEGNPFNGYLSYEIGIFNGTGSNSTNNNDDFDYAGRLILHPTRGNKGGFDAAIGTSYAWGQQQGMKSKDINLKTETRSNNTYFTAEIPTDRGYNRERQSIGATLLYGSSMLNGEYLRTDYDFNKKTNIQGGYIGAGYLLSGEGRFIKDGRVRYEDVRRPVDFEKGQWGCWEMGVRYSWFKVDDRFFQNNGIYSGWTAVDVTKNVNKGNALTTGVSWRFNDMSRIVANWVHSKADNDLIGGTSNIFTLENGNKMDTEDAYLMRFQIEF
ncbi:MAG: hypothetical protein HZA18_06890 [Nitrospirae bacterium]|nr:hypothetical protein [Nitrospirota bacterium]